MRRKSLFAGLMAVQLLAALATCQLGSSTATHPGPQPTPRYRPVTPEHRGGTLVLADWEAPTTLDPIHATTVSSLRVSSLLFAPLWGLDPDLLPYPDLVREVPSLENHDVRVGADGVSMTVLIKLVPGLRWSDGQPLTVDDVTFTVDAICAGSRDATGFDRIVAQERRSATELLWRFGPRHAGTCNLTSDISSGLYPALDLLGPRARILPRHSLAALPSGDWPTSSFFRHPEASSGPFAFRGSLATDLIDLGANPHYADGRSAAGVYGVAPIRFDHPPSLDGLTFRFYLSRAALLAGLKAGESDVGFHLAAADAEELRGPPTSETIISPSLQGEYLNPNHAVNSQTHRTPPWVGDPAVLDALKLAIDRPALNRAAFGGTAAVAQGLFPGSMRSYALANSIPAGDPAAAARLLDTDGWKVGAGGTRFKSGRKLEFTLLIPCGSAPRVGEQQELVTQMGAAGFAVTADCRPRGQFFASFLDHGINATGAFDMTLYSNTWPPDPSAWTQFGISSQMPDANSPGGQNWNRCEDPGIDRSFSAGDHTLSRQARRQAYLEGAAAWLRYGCTIPLLEWPAVVQRSIRLRNFLPNPNESMDTWNAADWWLSA